MSNEVQILRVVISSNVSGTVLTDCMINWPYLNASVSKICQVLLQIATEFDDGTIQFASFELPETKDQRGPPTLTSQQNSEKRYLNLGLSLKDGVITAIFYRIMVDKRKDEHADYVSRVSEKIAKRFAEKHGALHESLRETLENMVKEKATMPKDAEKVFASFASEIPDLINSQ